MDPALVARWFEADGRLHYTDDTAMMLVLAAHLCDQRSGLDEGRLAGDFARAWRTEPGRGYGEGPPRIFTAILAGDDWSHVARDLFGGSGSLGNGGAMRVAPVGLLPHDVGQVASLARRQAAITHAHPLGKEGAALQAAAVAIALRTADTPLDPDQFLSELGSHAVTETFAAALARVRDAVRRALPPRQTGIEVGHDVTAAGSVPSAVTAFLQHPEDVVDALRFAIEAGGDTDTIAAMTGAIVGARCGAHAIPEGWRRRLENHRELVVLADRLSAFYG